MSRKHISKNNAHQKRVSSTRAKHDRKQGANPAMATLATKRTGQKREETERVKATEGVWKGSDGKYHVAVKAPTGFVGDDVEHALSLMPKGYENDWVETVIEACEWVPRDTSASCVSFNCGELGWVPVVAIYKKGFFPSNLDTYFEDLAPEIERKVLLNRIAEMRAGGYKDRSVNPASNPKGKTCAAIVFDYEEGRRVFPFTGEAMLATVESFQMLFQFEPDIHEAIELFMTEAGYLAA